MRLCPSVYVLDLYNVRRAIFCKKWTIRFWRPVSVLERTICFHDAVHRADHTLVSEGLTPARSTCSLRRSMQDGVCLA